MKDEPDDYQPHHVEPRNPRYGLFEPGEAERLIMFCRVMDKRPGIYLGRANWDLLIAYWYGRMDGEQTNPWGEFNEWALAHLGADAGLATNGGAFGALESRHRVAADDVAFGERLNHERQVEISTLVCDLVADYVTAHIAPPARLPREAVAEHRGAPITLAARYRLRNLRLFGSVSRGTDTAESDVDLLAAADEGASLMDVSGFALNAEELLGFHVDVVTEGGLRPGHPIRSEAIALEGW